MSEEERPQTVDMVSTRSQDVMSAICLLASYIEDVLNRSRISIDL